MQVMAVPVATPHSRFWLLTDLTSWHRDPADLDRIAGAGRRARTVISAFESQGFFWFGRRMVNPRFGISLPCETLEQ